MTEREWVECADPQEILKALRGKCSNRKLRLFSCACCRRIWQFITDPGSQAIVEIVEQCTDGLVDTQRILSLDWDRLTDNCGGPGRVPRNCIYDCWTCWLQRPSTYSRNAPLE